MANKLTIFLAILGDPPASDNMFSVITLDSTISVDEWKKSVYAEGPTTLERWKPADLVLWKLNAPIASKEVDDKVAALADVQKLQKVATKMAPADDLSDHFAGSPPRKYLHVIVQLPSPSLGSKRKRVSEPGTSSSDSDAPPDHKKQKVQHKPRLSDLALADGLYSRSETVETLYKKLMEHKFIFVRGTPASGKSSLALLLHNHIAENDSEKEVWLVPRYRDEPDQKPIMGWQEWLEGEGWKSPKNGVLILDEAQLSYWDDSFWLSFIKSTNASTSYMVILFASYGSAGRNLLNRSTPLVVEKGQLVGLARNPTEASIGLSLTREEMEGVVKKSFPNHRFDVSLLDYVHSLTSGHVGACYDALSVVWKDKSYRENTRKYTYDDFILNFEMSTFLKKLGSRGVFSRGLPMRDDLEDPKKPFVRNLCDVLKAPLRSVLLEKEHDQRDSKHPLRLCLEQGWLFSEPADGAMVKYRPDLQTFVIEVIKRYSPQNLQTREDLSATPQLIPEAQFQHEFYRACGVYTGGCVTIFPECGTPKGRIDFFIRSKKWGVELVRDGVRLREHDARFTSGEYGTWLHDGNMKDYIMIDFRSKMPNQARGDIRSLIYVVSTNNWESLEIYNNKLENINSFRLFYHDPW